MADLAKLNAAKNLRCPGLNLVSESHGQTSMVEKNVKEWNAEIAKTTQNQPKAAEAILWVLFDRR